MAKSFFPSWVLKHDNGEQTSPRFLHLVQPDTSSEDISPSDLKFADMRLFPQVLIEWIQEHEDLCEHYGLFPEYTPYLGYITLPTDDVLFSSFLKMIVSLCQSQYRSQQEPYYLDI